jgi:hypothetical protein
VFEDIKTFVNNSGLESENKKVIFDLLDHYAIRRNSIDPSKLAAEDLRIKNLILGAVAAYKQEIDYNRLDIMLVDTFKKTGQDIEQITANVKSAVNFFSSPIVLVLIVIGIIVIVVYVKVIR